MKKLNANSIYNNIETGIVSVSATVGETTCTLDFVKRTSAEIQIKRRVGEGSWTILSNVSGSQLADTGLSAATSYQYAFKLVGFSSWDFAFIETNPLSVPSDLIIVDTGYQHTTMEWTHDQVWDAPYVIQRKSGGSWVDPDWNSPLGLSNFKILGLGQTRFTDLDDLVENTTYQYRISACTNVRAIAESGATPTYSTWKETEVTIGVRETGTDATYDVTDSAYGATGIGDDYPAFSAAVEAARAAGGGDIFIPAGSYELWLPTDDVLLHTDGTLYIPYSGTKQYSFFGGDLSNIHLIGEVDSNGDPATFITLKLPYGEPMTKYIEMLQDGKTTPGDHSETYVSNVQRATFAFLGNGTENFTVKNIFMYGGAYPVNTGKEWYTLDQKRYEWDISHKFVSSTNAARNIVIDNVHTTDWRGEVFYCGGDKNEKWLIKNTKIWRTNSSALSGSYDLEVYNTEIYEASNCSIESAIFANQTSSFTGQKYYHQHLVYENLFVCLDQSSEGVMKNLPGQKSFSGIHIFNEGEEDLTTQVVVNNEIRDYGRAAYGPWYSCVNAFVFRNHFKYPCVDNIYGTNCFYTWTVNQQDYGLVATFHKNLWLDNHLYFDQSHDNGFGILYTSIGSAVTDEESDFHIEKLHIHNDSGGPITLNILWTDITSATTGRENFLWKDWTRDAGVNFAGSGAWLYNSNIANKIWPEFDNVDLPRQLNICSVISGTNLRLYFKWIDANLTVYNQAAGTVFYITEIPNIAKYLPGTVFTIKIDYHNVSKGDSFVFPSSAAWNTFSTDKTLTNTSQVLTMVSNNSGTLDFVSLV